MQSFYSHGKLLLTGEYVVLDGAIALAVPTKFGQSLNVNPIEEQELHWKSLDLNGNIWFEDIFWLNKSCFESENSLNETSQRLIQILNACKQLNPDFLVEQNGIEVITKLEFPNNWGLGTSSTLINNIAKWAKVNPYKLLDRTFGGSGYDIACANHDSSITYRLSSILQNKQSQITEKNRSISKVSFNPSFSENLFFIHLNKKQDSRKGIKRYQSYRGEVSGTIAKVNSITEQIINCDKLETFEILVQEHESIISELIGLKPIKHQLFSDFNGSIKSLGAWGGDFILATGSYENMNYFRKKGFSTIFPYTEMVL